MKELLLKLIKSRQFWTVFVLVVGDIVVIYGKYLSSETIALINALLGIMIVYFRVESKVDFKNK